jgi:hypothetical protein
VGFALTTVAGLGLLIERSPDLTADIGRQEMLVGLSFVVAPAIGACPHRGVRAAGGTVGIISFYFIRFNSSTTYLPRPPCLLPLPPNSTSPPSCNPHHPPSSPGGVLYTYVGFASIFLLLSLAFAVVALLLAGALKSGMLAPPGTITTTSGRSDGSTAAAAAAGVCLLQAACCPMWCQRRGWGQKRARREEEGDDDEEEGRRAPLLGKGQGQEEEERSEKEEGEEEGPPPIGLWGMLRLPGLLAAGLVVLMSFNSIGWMELSLSSHAKASLRLPPWGVGLLFSTVDSAYAITGYCLPRIRTAAGGCRPLALAGLACQALAFAVLGPLPTPWSNSGSGSGGGVADGVLAWGSVVLGVRRLPCVCSWGLCVVRVGAC